MVSDAIMDRVPVKRVSVTQEWLASQVASGNKEHPASAHFGEILYLSIERMIFRLANNWKPTCREFQLEDLVNDCYCRILEKLDTFDPEKGKFTTWTWRVSESVLTRRYHEAKKHKDNRVDSDSVNNRSLVTNLHLRTDINGALVELFYEWPEHFEIFRAMFGGTPFALSVLESREESTGGFSLPDTIDIKRIAVHSDISSHVVRKVFKNVVRPFFTQWFGEKDEQESE